MPPRELLQERRALEEKADRIRRELAGLRPEQDAEARELKTALQKIEQGLRELRPPRTAWAGDG